MCQFIETIQISDGEIRLLEYHNRRMNRTIQHYFGNNKPIDLKEYITPLLERGRNFQMKLYQEM